MAGRRVNQAQGEQQDVMSCHVNTDSHDLGPAISEEANLGSQHMMVG